MIKRSTKTHDGGGASRTRLGTRAVAAVATFSLVASMLPGATALAFASEQLAVGAGDAGAQAISAQAEGVTEVTSGTHRMASGAYRVTGDVAIKPDGTGNGIQVEKGAKVLLEIAEGATLTVTGGDADGNGVGHAAILLPEGSTLTVAGAGTLNATGGKAGNGVAGGNAAFGRAVEGADEYNPLVFTGDGGSGGAGGGGAGAGIGTDGGSGGKGGSGGAGVQQSRPAWKNVYGNDGGSGSAGSPAAPAGTLIVSGTATVNAKGGAAAGGGAAGERGYYTELRLDGRGNASSTSGGGGGGGGGTAADGIGSGGTGGGGGGGGASGNIDGEPAVLKICDLDDLWSHGGDGGLSVWGGGNGSHGDEGANGGDDTDVSRKYAKSGGTGGICPTPKAVPFYTYWESGATSIPTVNCTAGCNVNRSATHLVTLKEFVDYGGYVDLVSGGTFVYDGQPHGVTVGETGGVVVQSGGSALQAQADGDGVYSGTETVDGVEVSWSVSYYDEAGAKLGSEPVMPGSYAAVVSLKTDDDEGDVVVPITITKRQVEKPAPAALTFECGDWDTGEGKEQDAFASIDFAKADYEFVADAQAEDGAASLKSAKDVGAYWACFKLKDTATCQWADGSESAECWVPWAISLAEFDPNDVAYWGPAYDNETTAVDYTGEPIWVRPWFTPTKATDGRFPTWLTHWGSGDRPTYDRSSAVVVYTQGDDDLEGLVGYHTGADGSLEKVTGAQVYAWMFGVDVDGTHVDVQSGDKVWYETGDDGEVTVLGVQAERPTGADGASSIVARDLAYADRLGVKDAGTYQAYAYFDDGAGFAPTALAESTVEVKAAANTPRTGGSKASATPRTVDPLPLATAGLVAAALLGAGVLVLARARRNS